MIYQIKTYREWDKILKNNSQLFVIFTSSFCDTCKDIIAKANNSNILIYEINLNDMKSLSYRYNITETPTMSIIENELQIFSTSKLDIIVQILNDNIFNKD